MPLALTHMATRHRLPGARSSLAAARTQLGPGVFTLRNAVYLRSHVHLRGTEGGATVLKKAAGHITRIVRDSDWYENVVEVEDAVRLGL